MKQIKRYILISIVLFSFKNQALSQIVAKLDTITETSTEPYNQVCFIETYRVRKFSKNGTFKSTGFFIAPNVILTAGHNLYSNRLTKVTNIKIIPGRYKENSAFDIIELKGELTCQNSIIVHPSFKWNKVNYDFGIIIIPDSLILKTAKWPKSTSFKLDSGVELKIGDTLNVSGFPANNGYDGSLMTYESQICYNVFENKISHRFKTETGNSGSPIWIIKNEESFIVGVHTYANAGTLIDKKYIELIQNWIEQKTIR